MGKNSNKSFLKNKKFTFALGVLSAVIGFFFLDINLTGNTISTQSYGINLISLIGVLLFFCAGILFFYSLKKA